MNRGGPYVSWPSGTEPDVGFESVVIHCGPGGHLPGFMPLNFPKSSGRFMPS